VHQHDDGERPAPRGDAELADERGVGPGLQPGGRRRDGARLELQRGARRVARLRGRGARRAGA
jgi:hypothetical protein